MTLSATEQRVLDAVAALREPLVELLGRLVAEPSLTGREGSVQAVVAQVMRELGLEVDVWEPRREEFKDHPEFAAHEEFAGRPNVVGIRRGAGGGPSLGINGHVDVVPAGDERQWHVPPFRLTREGDRLYGRGACDMKGGVAGALIIVRALEAAGVRLKGDLMLQSVIGEENGGVGTLAAILRGHVPDAVLIPEPTRTAVVPAQGGCLMFRITVTGRSAHAAMRNVGVSALEKWYPIHRALLELEAERHRTLHHPLYEHHINKIPLNVGRLTAGEWPSSAPDRLVAEGRYGIIPGEDVEAARRAFHATVERVAAEDEWLREHPPLIEWVGAQFDCGQVDIDTPLVATLREVFEEVTGRPPAIEGVTWGADMRLFTNLAHVPAILFGAGNVAVAHYPDEHISLDELILATGIQAVTAMRFCGVAT